ncbi:hypothetical protein [Prosthecobacter sp.]|uniref:hypothetical protein n=1 Tax=Prosthecobacter sp. TaxID=1965333 RepID=UPI0037833EA0
MRIHVSILLTLAVLTHGLHAAPKATRRSNIIQSRLRLLPRVNFQRSGLGEEEAGTITAGMGWYEKLSRILSMQFRTSSMFSVTDNVFNTQSDAQSDTQYAQFAGLSLDAEFSEHWAFSNTFDESWFYYGRADNASEDFVSSTFRQMLSYDRVFFDKKLDVNLPLSWEFSRLFNRATGARTLDSHTYRAAAEFSWFCRPWFTPAWSYEYFYQDNGSPTDFVPGKHKHNLNLGVTFTPFKGHKFYLIPSVQYSVEQFIHVVRTDRIWTPAVTMTWQPFKCLAFDVIGTYTRSASTQDDSSYKVFSTTIFARLFFDW